MATAFNNRGSEYSSKGDLDKAIANHTKAIRLDPKYASAYNERAEVYDKKGMHDKATADRTESARLDPDMAASSYRNRGWVDFMKGEYDKAIADYTEAIRLDPEYFRAYHERAQAYDKKGEHDKAIADYSECIRLDPRASHYNERGWVYHDKKGEYDKAIADYDKALRLDPNFAEALNNLAWLYATCPDEKYRDGKKAVENANKACQLTAGGNWRFVDTLAAAYAESGDFEKAKEWESKAIELPATDKSAKAEMVSRLELYKQGKPYREERKK